MEQWSKPSSTFAESTESSLTKSDIFSGLVEGTITSRPLPMDVSELTGQLLPYSMPYPSVCGPSPSLYTDDQYLLSDRRYPSQCCSMSGATMHLIMLDWYVG